MFTYLNDMWSFRGTYRFIRKNCNGQEQILWLFQEKTMLRSKWESQYFPLSISVRKYHFYYAPLYRVKCLITCIQLLTQSRKIRISQISPIRFTISSVYYSGSKWVIKIIACIIYDSGTTPSIKVIVLG